MTPILRIEGEVIELHCDLCGKKCYAPSEEQLLQWESSGPDNGEPMKLMCTDCLIKYPSRRVDA